MKRISKLFLVMVLILPAIFMFSACGEVDIDLSSNDSGQTQIQDITGVTFNSQTFSYNGEEQILLIQGDMPEGVTVDYTNNTATNAGTYNSTATLSGEGYNELILNATLQIDKGDITGLLLNNITVDYDGTSKLVEVEGTLPAGINLTYTIDGQNGNSAINAGTYAVVATISGTNYNTLILNSTLVINEEPLSELLNIEGISFTDANYTYDSLVKELLISGQLPQDVTVEYTNNTATNAGTYSSTATLSGEGYNELILNATLQIDKANVTGISLNNINETYDETSKQIEIEGTLPIGTNVTYTIDGQNGNSAINIGSYNIVATVSGLNYNALVLNATLKINPDVSGFALSILTEVLLSPDPWSFLPDSFSLANRGYSGSVLDFSSFVNVSEIPTVGTGKQMNVVYDLLIQSEEALAFLNAFYEYTDVVVDAYQLFINNNPDNYASFEHSTENFDFKIELTENTSTILVSFGSVAIELSYNDYTNTGFGRVQLSDSNVLKYEMSNNYLKIAGNISNVVLAQVEFVRVGDLVTGYIYEFAGTNEAYLTSSALLNVGVNYTTVIGSKGDFVVPTQGRVVEVYDNATGSYVGSEVKETVSLINYDTLWYSLSDITGIDSVKKEDLSNDLNSDTIYVNGSVNTFVAKRGNFGLGSRYYDIEFKTVYLYQYNLTTESYDKISMEIPMLFVQYDYLDSYESIAYNENDENGISSDLINTLTIEEHSTIDDGYVTLLPLYEAIRLTVSYQDVIDYLGSKDIYFTN